MTADTDEEIAQLVEAVCYSVMWAIFLIWGFLVGANLPGFFGKVASPKRGTPRTVLYALAAGSFVAALGLWVLSEEGGDVVRSDGRTGEYSRQIAIGLASIAMVYAYAMYSRFTHSAMIISVFFVFVMYACLAFTTLTPSDTLQAIFLAFWLASLISLGLFGWSSIAIHGTWIYGNYVAGVLFLVFALLQGLWLILSEQVAREISTTVEAGLYTATDIFMLAIFGLILGFTFPGTRPLFTRSDVSAQIRSKAPKGSFTNVRGQNLRQR